MPDVNILIVSCLVKKRERTRHWYSSFRGAWCVVRSYASTDVSGTLSTVLCRSLKLCLQCKYDLNGVIQNGIFLYGFYGYVNIREHTMLI